MKSLLNLIKLDLKVTLTKKINWILNVIIIIQLLQLLNFRQDKFQALYASGFITQTIILGFMIIGFNVFRKDREHGYDDILNVINNGKFKRNISTCIAAIIYALLNSVLLIVIVGVYYKFNGIDFDLIVHSIGYMVLYWLMPSITALLVGSVLALIKTSKSMYSIIVIISMIIGPISKNFLKEVVSILPLHKFMYFLEYINLGQFFINGSVDSLYGFEIEWNRVFNKGLFLVVILNIFLILNCIKYCKRKIKPISIIAIIVLGICVLMGIYKEKSFIYKQSHFEKDCIQRYDFEYYKKMKNPKINEDICKLNSMDVYLIIKDNIKVQSKMNINTLKDIKEVKFSLYHDLKVNKVSLKGRSLNYSTKGDIVNIKLPHYIKKGNNLILDIEYEGKTSPYYYSNKRATLLPGYYNWLPSLNLYNSMYITNLGIKSNVFRYAYDVKYKLRTNIEVATNLKKVSKNCYEGTSKSGVTVIDGLYKTLKVSNMKVVYSRLNSNLNDNKIKLLSEKIYKSLTKISQEFNIDIDYKRPIFFVPVMDRGTMNSFNTYILDDYICTKIYKLNLEDSRIKEELIDAIVEDKIKDENYKNMFTYFYGIWVNNEQNNSPDVKEVFTSNVKTCENIQVFICKNNKIKVQEFFRKWLKLMDNNTNFNKSDLNKLLKSME